MKSRASYERLMTVQCSSHLNWERETLHYCNITLLCMTDLHMGNLYTQLNKNIWIKFCPCFTYLTYFDIFSAILGPSSLQCRWMTAQKLTMILQLRECFYFSVWTDLGDFLNMPERKKANIFRYRLLTFVIY